MVFKECNFGFVVQCLLGTRVDIYFKVMHESAVKVKHTYGCIYLVKPVFTWKTPIWEQLVHIFIFLL